jgi:lycopene beta-cyclase
MVAESAMKPAYDFVIAGGGLAGLSLACHLVRSPLCGASILVVDRASPDRPDRLWSYWTDQPTLFDPVVEHAWSQLHIANRAYAKTFALPSCRYELVRAGALDHFARQELALHTQVDFCQGAVERSEDGPRGARVLIDGQPIRADWVFDSTDWPGPTQHSRGRLAMYFKGWTLQAPRPTFNPQAVTFLDTRTPQKNELRFFYVLPFSEQQALVEFVVYSRACPPREEPQSALQAYLRTTLGLTDFEIVTEESGCLPILPGAPRRRLGPHRLAIGAKAGLIKPTTGFAFRRIQQDSGAIVRSLVRTGRPWHLPAVSKRHRLYDALLLDALAQQGEKIETIFAALFARNPLERVLRFLDESTSPAEDLALIATLPPRAFIKALPRSAAALAGL